MPIYLATMIPSLRGRVPAGTEGLTSAQCNWLYFRLEDRALVWSTVPISHAGAILIATDVDEALNSPTARGHLQTFVGDRTFPSTLRWRDALVDMLRQPPAKWRGLVASHDGWIRLWFGPGTPGQHLLYEERTAPRQASRDVEDTFTRANADLAGSTSSDAQFTWSEAQGTAITVVSNAAEVSGNGGFNVGVVSVNMDTADHYAEVVIATWTPGTVLNIALGPLIRLVDGTGGSDGYGFEVYMPTPTTYLRRVYDFGTDSNLGATDTVATSSGTWRLEMTSNNLTASVNGSTILGGPTTDPSPYTAGRRTGMSLYSTDATGVVAVASFRAADLVAAPPPAPVYVYPRWRKV